ncbi:hypothetical protein [Roseicyclus mahoneyensis]|uniref:SH3 domain-containing protein n=1 Tax=Roseicyclus mahoneyensis TaxID=164332 RepID=A0A316GFT3_9RHOB|nr:hypothetical protein [Roseicyclus mahoneyensis]PWK59095.1 hypothetical protein C7455_10917 [Roseicyclus mahoneyensis]
MRPFESVRAAFLALIFGALPAMAQPWFYDHNGSVMRLDIDGARFIVTYDRPRTGLADVGVVPGTVLFEGVTEGPNYVGGMAWVFSRRCGNIDYYVYGPLIPGSSFTLTGAAPVRDATCRIVDNSMDGPNGRLVFTAMGGAPRPVPPTPQPAPQPQQATGSVCVGQTGGAALRTGPGLGFGRLATLPQGTCGGSVATGVTQGWVGVVFGRSIGWVPMSSLRF